MATEQKVEGFTLEVLPGLGKNGGIIHFGIADTPYQTEWTPDETITFAVQLITAANASRYQADLFVFMRDVMNLDGDTVMMLINGAGMYANATPEKRAKIAEDARLALMEMENNSGIPPEEM